MKSSSCCCNCSCGYTCFMSEERKKDRLLLLLLLGKRAIGRGKGRRVFQFVYCSPFCEDKNDFSLSGTKHRSKNEEKKYVINTLHSLDNEAKSFSCACKFWAQKIKREKKGITYFEDQAELGLAYFSLAIFNGFAGASK